MRRAWVGILAGMIVCSEPVAGQTLGEWLNDRVDEAVAARLSQRSAGRQVEAPALARGATGLLNTPSFADLVGVALTLVPVGSDAGEDGTGTTAVTLTPYSILSAVLGLDPDNPIELHRHRGWRSVALTLGTEEANEESGAERATLVGVKYLVLDKQRIDPASQTVRDLRTALGIAGTAFRQISDEVQDSLFNWVGPSLGMSNVDFINQLSNSATALPSYLQLIGSDRIAVLYDIIAARVDPFVRARRAADQVVEGLRSAPQLSIDVQSRLVDSGQDEVRLGVVFDLGLNDRTNWTFNGAATVRPGIDEAEDQWGATVASGFRIALGDDGSVGPDPIAVDLGFDGTFLDEQSPTWRLQGKLQIPVTEGISVPISVTWASRTTLVDESDVIGRVGFTVDTSRLLGATGGG